MSGGKVYLAGPIKGLSYDWATDWREYADGYLSWHGIRGISPMRAKEYLKNEVLLKDGYDDKVLSCAKGITTRDRYDVRTCDLMLANFEGAAIPSLGTCIEFGWADAYRKPVIMVASPDNPHWHPMMTEIAGFIVPNLDEGLHVCCAILAE
jgi:nucleoside 2-deoxyribosyltransferase